MATILYWTFSVFQKDLPNQKEKEMNMPKLGRESCVKQEAAFTNQVKEKEQYILATETGKTHHKTNNNNNAQRDLRKVKRKH